MSTACYVGETGRHMQSRFKEHVSRAGPMRNHLIQCNATLTENDVDILQQTSRGEGFLLTLEALYIRECKPLRMSTAAGNSLLSCSLVVSSRPLNHTL